MRFYKFKITLEADNSLNTTIELIDTKLTNALQRALDITGAPRKAIKRTRIKPLNI